MLWKDVQQTCSFLADAQQKPAFHQCHPKSHSELTFLLSSCGVASLEQSSTVGWYSGLRSELISTCAQSAAAARLIHLTSDIPRRFLSHSALGGDAEWCAPCRSVSRAAQRLGHHVSNLPWSYRWLQPCPSSPHRWLPRSPAIPAHDTDPHS